MSWDLTLLPFDGDMGYTNFSHTVLSCIEDYDLFKEIEKLPSVRAPEDFSTYMCRDEVFEEEHYGNTQTSPDGKPLTYVLAEQLVPFASHKGMQDNFKNRAIWAYLKELPPRTKVALYWGH